MSYPSGGVGKYDNDIDILLGIVNSVNLED